VAVSIGDPAPDFSGATLEGNLSLSDFAGKKLAVYFYPKDNTPGCTKQACSLRDGFAELQRAGIAIVGVSTDSLKSHQKFADKYTLPFPLISDPDRDVIAAFGSWGKKKFRGREYMGTLRQTFLVDESGTVVDIITKPNTKEHGREVLERFAALD
jgi:peroxiredoxin Q/BCP